MTVQWIQTAWKEASSSVVKRFFEKCGLRKIDDDVMEDEEEEDAKFSALVKGLCLHHSAGKYVDFDATVSTAEPQFKTHAVDWQQKSRNECTEKVTDPPGSENKIISGYTNEEEDDEEGEYLIGPSIIESLTMLDQVCKCHVKRTNTSNVGGNKLKSQVRQQG